MTPAHRRDHLDPTATIDLLKKILTDLPKLDGALCIGEHELFDAHHPDEDPSRARKRHERAAALCHRCPVIDACDTFTAGERDIGQVRAGHQPDRYGTPGRPSRSTTRDSEKRPA